MRSARRWPRRRSLEGGRRQDLHPEAQEAVPAGARSAREAVVERAVHHAGTHREDRRSTNITERDRLRSLQVRQGRMGAGQQGRLREEHRLCAAQGAAVVGMPAARWSRSTASSGSIIPDAARRRSAQAGRGRLVEQMPPDLPESLRSDPNVAGRDHQQARLDGPICASTTFIRRSTTRRCARPSCTWSTRTTTCAR